MVNATTETLTWTGACSDGLAEGEGTLTVNIPAYGDTIIVEETGHLQNGRKHGQWVIEGPWVVKNTYVNGVYHGLHFTRWRDGST